LNRHYQSINKIIFHQEASFAPWWMETRNIVLATIFTGFILCGWTWTVQHSEHPLIAYQTAHTAPDSAKRPLSSPSPKKTPPNDSSPQESPPSEIHVDWWTGFSVAAGAAGAAAAYLGASALTAAGVTAGTLAGGTILVTAAPATAALAVGVAIFIVVRAVLGTP
jgi:hypothetical protein